MKSKVFDVCVVGGGPAGSTAATLIAMSGYRVLLIEKESLPVYKIGESLLPATVHGVCPLLGVSEDLLRANFVKKNGGTFRWGRAKEPWTFAFAESSKFPGPTSFAYQVERIKFDTILLDNARRKGVEVCEQTQAQDLVVEDGRVVGVNILERSGTDSRVSCKYVVDACGHSSRIAKQAGVRTYSERFRNVAVFGYFLDGGRLPAPNAGNIFSVAFAKGWCWYIPLSPTLTSVGVVIDKEYASVFHQGPRKAFESLISECSEIKNLLTSSRPCDRPPYDEIRIRQEYSYCHSQFWSPGLVIVGDAACFIDPVFSSGVHLATYSALLAARSINTRLRGELTEERAFAEFDARYRREYKLFHDFLCAFYDVDQDLDSYYWTARHLMSEEVPYREALVTLVGGNASSDLIIADSTERLERQMLSEQLFPAAMGVTSDMYLESSGRTGAGRQFWRELNREGTQLQIQSALKGCDTHERPLLLDGLVASADGLYWESNGKNR
jgi:FAD-dependent halogenase